MRIGKGLIPLLCGFATLLMAGCANQPPRHRVDAAVVREVLAKVMKPGDVLLHDGGMVVMGPRNAAELVSGLEKHLSETPQLDLEGILRKLQEVQNQEAWVLPMKTRFDFEPEKLSKLCDSYVRNFVLLRLRGLPKKLKTIQLDAERENGETVGSCSYKVIPGGITSTLTGERIAYSGKLFYADLGAQGVVHLAPMLRARQLDMAKPVQEFLLIVPEDKADALSLSRIVEATANQMYKKIGPEWAVAFTLAKRRTDGTGVGSLGLRRIAVAMANGEIMQLESIRLHVGRSGPAGGALSPADTHVVLEVANVALGQHMKAGTLKEYRDGDFERDSRAFLEAAGSYAADTIGIGKVAIVSSFGEIAENGQLKLNIPAIFVKQGNEWVFEPPKKSPVPDEKSLPSI